MATIIVGIIFSIILGTAVHSTVKQFKSGGCAGCNCDQGCSSKCKK